MLYEPLVENGSRIKRTGTIRSVGEYIDVLRGVKPPAEDTEEKKKERG